MSDTPNTDELANREFVPDGVWIRHARQLERENAALKAALDHQMSYQRELRADRDRLDWLTNSLGWIIVGEPEADPSQHATEEGTLADAWRAAIDAAMGEGKQ